MKYDITYSCGHKGTVDLIGKTEDRERKIYGYEHYGICPECQAKKRQEESNKNAEIFQQLGFPKLEGSEKQIAWAETIRANFLNKEFSMQDKRMSNKDLVAEIKKQKEEDLDKFMEYEKDFIEKNGVNADFSVNTRIYYVAILLKMNSAKWFIENRFDL